jgi:NitT/TauT family transport system substrate-binding protein
MANSNRAPLPSSRRRFFGLGLGLAALASCKRKAGGPLRLGHFPNVTHAAALIAAQTDQFAKALGDAPLEILTFNAGPAAVEALLSEALDIAYIGPNPTLNAYVKSKGQAVRVIAGATSGGAAFIVAPNITSAEQLRGTSVASPQLGGTQDVALRAWLAKQGLTTDAYGGGDVSILPQENAQTLEAFRTGKLSGAWVPEPWATRLVQEGGGKLFLDERTLWPGGRFVTTHLIVRTELLSSRADEIRALVRAHVEATRWIAANPDAAQAICIDRIELITGKRLAAPIIAAAWPNMEFTTDPLADSLRECAQSAVDVGLLDLEGVSLDGLWDLELLEQVEREVGN